MTFEDPDCDTFILAVAAAGNNEFGVYNYASFVITLNLGAFCRLNSGTINDINKTIEALNAQPF